jgi:16S rRNA (cytosine967-C5)-methyltransferase
MGESSVQSKDARQVAFLGLLSVQRGAFADVALDQLLHRSDLSEADRRLVTELVYGCVRRSRTLDALITQLAKKPADQQPPKLRLILHLGLYQLRYLSQIPPSAAVDTTVSLARQNGLSGLTGFANGLLRQYLRLKEQAPDPLQLPNDPVSRIAVLHSFPEWIVEVWRSQFGLETAEQLCEWLNRPPHIDLRVNPLLTTLDQVEAAMQDAGVAVSRIPGLPQALRLPSGSGAVQRLPGFSEGWWSVQDGSAQLVGHLLDPQPGETVVDACAAPGGKTTHIAELMGDRGVVWGCDRNASRLKKLTENAQRLKLHSIQLRVGDSRSFEDFRAQADRVLLDAPCSGLGTLHRHADARWRQTSDSVQQLAQLQTELLTEAATWVKPGGVLVYSTCTLHPDENEAVVEAFLSQHPDWQMDPLPHKIVALTAPNRQSSTGTNAPEWLKVLPPEFDLDGFFMVRLKRSGLD